jgi:thiamine pyrophosphate-dependent acetolactate synthase large subunit-like protein
VDAPSEIEGTIRKAVAEDGPAVVDVPIRD